jgi:formamidopyrimidine-DNA glycosylase
MPELPEVEVVRRGLEAHVAGKTITAVRVHHLRAVRRHEAGPADLTARLLNSHITGTGRRGKYLWLTLRDSDEPLGRGAHETDEPLRRGADETDEPLGRGADETDEPLGRGADETALVVHLGMSGQMLLGPVPNEGHLRIAALLDDGTTLSFVDQRTFGGWMLTDMVTVDGTDVPVPVAHIARDPLDPKFNRDGVVTVLRRKHSEIKRQLLDQTVVSGIGNIYADEALWRVKINGNRLASSLTRKQLGELLDAAAEVMTDALGQGGTSFDSLYVNVNGESGYFERSLDAYGREGEPCRRCGAVMRREKFMNRSSFYCPKCQPRPRVRRS